MINNTQYLTGGKSPNPLSPPTNLSAKAGNAQVTLTWTDPPNATSEPSGQTIATWAYTQVVRKEGSQPTGPNDGTLVVKSSVRDQYQTTGYIDTNLTNDTLYYYGAFAYNSDGVYSEGAFVSATPQAGTPIGELTEGTLITITENGAPVEFYVAKQGYEPTLNGSDRVLMVRKECHSELTWNYSANQNSYPNSKLDNWLNTTYKATLSTSVVNQIATTSFKYTVGMGSASVSTMERAIFTMALCEVWGPYAYENDIGSLLPIASTLKAAGVVQMTRSATNQKNVHQVLYNSAGGGPLIMHTDETGYSRPSFTLPSTALVDTNNALIES